ncbi:Formamidopyrimidine-DNA glycosylase H2TH domain-containing protein [Geopyxis carbonaria]|nr:Formamidopyrimidine-DNA glycosylase H2TH domain-containing protein [Geopyxis carbonaria]
MTNAKSHVDPYISARAHTLSTSLYHKMPEIGEIARIVKRLNHSLVGKTICSVTAADDNIVFKDTSGENFKAALEGRQVQAAKQWGKYFWLVMDRAPHPLMHFGMAGWIHIKNDPTGHYRAVKDEDGVPLWPPKYHKFIFKLKDSDDQIAFVDSRRLARIRLIQHEDGHDIRNVPPVSENGPDPVIEPISLEWLQSNLARKKVPVKTFLLDQHVLAGIGNWVGDEILYHARIHPETYTNNLVEPHITNLHKAITSITKTAVETDADSSKFPKNWLFLHRWGKGKKKVKQELPSGEKIEFVSVGGRTSAYMPTLQKVLGPVPGTEVNGKPKGKKTKKKDTNNGSPDESRESTGQSLGESEMEEEKPVVRKRKAISKVKGDLETPSSQEPDTKRNNKVKIENTKDEGTSIAETTGLRRSGRRKPEQ